MRQLVIVGGLIDQSVDSAVRDACDLGYLVTLVSDVCVAESATRHEASMSALQGFCQQCTSEKVVYELASGTGCDLFSIPGAMSFHHHIKENRRLKILLAIQLALFSVSYFTGKLRLPL